MLKQKHEYSCRVTLCMFMKACCPMLFCWRDKLVINRIKNNVAISIDLISLWAECGGDDRNIERTRMSHVVLMTFFFGCAIVTLA